MRTFIRIRHEWAERGVPEGGKQRANVTTNSVRKVCNACEAGGGAGRRARRSILYIIINKKSSQILPRTRRGSRGRQGRAEAGYKICSS